MSDALIVVDFQVDFVSGSLAVPGAEDAIPKVFDLIQAHHRHKKPVILTRDWHPANHFSFFDDPKFEDESWPAHCVQNTHGAAILGPIYSWAHPSPGRPPLLVSKGTVADLEAYSAFEGTLTDGTYLEDFLHDQNVKTVTVCGLAFDYCVRWTAFDASYDFDVIVARDATAAVSEATASDAAEEMEHQHVDIVNTADVIARLDA